MCDDKEITLDKKVEEFYYKKFREEEKKKHLYIFSFEWDYDLVIKIEEESYIVEELIEEYRIETDKIPDGYGMGAFEEFLTKKGIWYKEYREGIDYDEIEFLMP